jgi:hypothetical protein
MISFEDLKENALIIIDIDTKTFIVDTVYVDDTDYFVDIVDKLHAVKCCNNLILLKCNRSGYEKNIWFCFCNGKICVYDIFKSDLKHLSIINLW